ncbi:MAG: peptidylprolyl isomerase [Cyanobacteria bacterium P01_D01_bin.116]
MSQSMMITKEDILQQIKISCKIPEIIEQIISRKIITEAVAEAGITVEFEDLQKIANQIRLMNQLHSADDTWSWLEKHGLTLDDYEEMVYYNLISGKLVTHLFADKVEPYFFENKLNYSSAVIYEIILDDEDLAIELFYAIKEGEMSFFDVAHQYIQDKELSRKCGYLGKVQRQDLKPEISAAVFAVESPQLLKPIISSKGVHLILVEEIVQSELDNVLRLQIMSDLFSDWIKERVEEQENQLLANVG